MQARMIAAEIASPAGILSALLQEGAVKYYKEMGSL